MISFEEYRAMPMSGFVQIMSPLSGRWAKVSRRTGRIVAIKKSAGPWKNMPIIDARKWAERAA
jgi:hypothetical protein